jgi:hypothetical protein
MATYLSPGQLISQFATRQEAHRKLSVGQKICLFISANILKGKRRKETSFKPYHWVVLNSNITIDGKSVQPLLAKGSGVDDNDALKNKKIAFDIYTWGTEFYPVKGVTVEAFLDNFFGYISAA